MAVKTLGTTSTTVLTGLPYGGGPVAGGGDTGYSQADMATISQLIVGDGQAAIAAVPTGTTASGSPTISALSSITSLRAGMSIFGIGIPAGTIIVSVGSTTLVMSANATASASGVKLMAVANMPRGRFSRQGLLEVPGRGVLRVQPGDWVGVDASGWPILLSAEAIAFGNTSWSHS